MTAPYDVKKRVRLWCFLALQTMGTAVRISETMRTTVASKHLQQVGRLGRL